MRDRRRLELSPSRYRDAAAGERRRVLAELLELLDRSRHEPWYRWIADGRPELTESEYREHAARRPARAASARR